ncbi:MAG TPA: class I SAM-dependent methyltransferase, partial [Pyrinomonadaceae bacterium]|nr:class I SAM-dependent methyltransferase [Pyrinomonadaceae bacterium]
NVFGQFSFFLNYGYVVDGQQEFAAVELPEHFINKNSVKLVLELIQDSPVDGKRILDVGCGRGGTIYVLKTFFKPLQLDGLDLSSAALDFCRNAHRGPNISFHEGDAENLPFANGSFEVVTNVESSHTYPNIDRFYSEVFRVLVNEGYFLYTDLLAPVQVAESIRSLRSLGFELERERDITPNVLRSCDEIAGTRVQAFESPSNGEMVENFLATPGSLVYQEMRAGRMSYRILKLRKSR